MKRNDKRRWQRNRSIVFLSTLRLVSSLSVAAAPAITEIRIAPGPAALESRVPEATNQGHFLNPQAISALDVDADGNFILVGTMAFSHDANVWKFSADGTLVAKRYFPPWAPMQVAALANGRAAAVGLAYSRVTSPDPTVWLGPGEALFGPDLHEGLVQTDTADGQFARLRPGQGDWNSGWVASSLGELFVRGPTWLFKPPASFMDSDGHVREWPGQDDNKLPNIRAVRMAASADGRRLAFAWNCLPQAAGRLAAQTDSLQLWEVSPNRKLWGASPSGLTAPDLPDPVANFPELAKDFRFRPDKLLPGQVAASVALNRDGSRVACVEYGTWAWIREQPAIGQWDPPIHLINFLPKQAGRLRVFDGAGRQIFAELLPKEGLFEVGFDANANSVWCWPASWFSRGMAGEAWLPVNRPAHTIYRIHCDSGAVDAMIFPDAVAECALSKVHGGVLASCWDGWLYHYHPADQWQPRENLGKPARIIWSNDGTFAIAGTTDGRLMRFNREGKVDWTRLIPETKVPPLSKAPPEVVKGVPVFQGGRISGGEHAYVGDIWMIKAGAQAVFVDAGGTSGFALTQERLRALGINQVTHILQTHTHGDHCGGAYLWRAAGAKIVAPKSASFSQSWLMPMLTDYGIYPPRPVDIPLPLAQVGDETDLELSGLRFHALFVPGHSFDLTIYTTVLGGKRIAFTGDLGFENQDILHRCWGDAAKARPVLRVIREKLLRWNAEIVFTGHGVRTNGLEFLTSLVEKTEASLQAVESRP